MIISSLFCLERVYDYDYVDCLTKLDETSLPPKEAFYSNLTGEGITDEDYQQAHTVWKEFNMGSMKVLQMKTTSRLIQFGKNLIWGQ